MNRALMLLAFAILAALAAVSGIACDQTHYDMYLGTDAGAGFEAPPHEAGSDDARGAGDQADAGAAAD